MEESVRGLTFVNQSRAFTLGTNVLVAGSSRERRRGLLGVKAFEEGTGLWIVPCEAIHTFGMEWPIDSVFLAKDLRVKSIRSRIKPFRIAVCMSAYSVLELPAGILSKSCTAVGDQLRVLDSK